LFAPDVIEVAQIFLELGQRARSGDRRSDDRIGQQPVARELTTGDAMGFGVYGPGLGARDWRQTLRAP